MRRKRFPRWVAFGLAVALLSLGCGGDKPPAVKQAAAALDQAQAGIEQAAQSIAAMRKQSQELHQTIQEQRGALDSLIEKRLVLLRQQLDEYRERVERLPAEAETELKTVLNDLNQRLNGLAEQFRAYRDAPPETSAEARAQLESALKEFDGAFQNLEERLLPAKVESDAA